MAVSGIAGVSADRDTLLKKCDEMIVMLSAHGDSSKLGRLQLDIEALREQLLIEDRSDLRRPDLS